MNAVRQPLELERPRDFSELFNTAIAVYTQNFGTLIAISAAVVIPVNLIVLGLGLEQLFSEYDENPSVAQALIPVLVTSLVTTPLIAAMTVTAMLDLGAGREPSASASIQRGLEFFAPVFLALLLALSGVVLGLALLIIPGIYLAIRWYFVTQSVIVDGARGAAALRRSAELVDGSWWRVLGVTLGAGLIIAVPGAIIGIPFELGAQAAGRTVLSLIGQMLTETITAPFATVMLTLLYFDLRSRHRAAQVPGGGVGLQSDPSRPPDPPGLPPTP